MAFDNTNTGTLSKNDKKTEEKHPEYKGDATLKCPGCGNTFACWLSAWVKTVKKEGSPMFGRKFFSLSFTPKQQQGAKTSQQPAPQQTPADDIPF